MADPKTPKAPRVRKVSVSMTDVIALRDELLAIDTTEHDDAVDTQIGAVAGKLLDWIS